MVHLSDLKKAETDGRPERTVNWNWIRQGLTPRDRTERDTGASSAKGEDQGHLPDPRGENGDPRPPGRLEQTWQFVAVALFLRRAFG